ncbi:hypothetical protein E4T66_05850 [Sinimarinibacterium sp. CAU 1509]|uniref:lipase family protein n=1 Tax=Sinimarinibacterium sp. CAU 1509 TaxID=2562283 RepID=UPI0010ACC3AD|nr:lipase family protein [Sinimarinibacterium sp. CAU 1509]TJY63224.1 hypothetical protein E4T66_05850 [Sinimarinibacterium sp. CAU 1509]
MAGRVRVRGGIQKGVYGAAVLLSAVLAACGSDSSGGNTVGQGPNALPAAAPDADAFYDAPAAIPDVPGTILKYRAITYQPAGLSLPNPAWQLQYVTRDGHGRPLAAVTTVVKPLVPNLYGHPVLLSFQHAYDSLGAECTPSHTATGSSRNTTNMAETLEFLSPLQALGWTMVIPDYEGPYHAFGAGPLSGQATLDAIRAALQFEPLGLAADTPAALWGYSGGAYASSWAAALHPSYAPEIQLVGAVSGGTPVDFVDIMQRNEDTSSFGFLFTLVIGMARDYPEVLPASLLTPMGADVVDAMKDSCEGTPPDGFTLDGGRMTDYVADDDPYHTPGFQTVMPKVTLLQADRVPTTDNYLYHEIDDELVPVAGADALAAKWCAEGVPLNYFQSSAGTVTDTLPTGVHTSGAAIGTPAAIAYIAGRFANPAMSVTPPGTVRCN